MSAPHPKPFEPDLLHIKRQLSSPVALGLPAAAERAGYLLEGEELTYLERTSGTRIPVPISSLPVLQKLYGADCAGWEPLS